MIPPKKEKEKEKEKRRRRKKQIPNPIHTFMLQGFVGLSF
jgi:hypothetical protein